MKPRIVLGVTSSKSLGLVRGFPEFLTAKGWDVHVVSAAGTESDTMMTNPALTVHVIEMRRDPSPVRDLVALVAWTRLLRSLRPQVVMVGTPKAGLLGILGAALTRVPMRVYQVRGLRLETTSGLLRRLLWLLEWVTFKASTSALAVSNSLRRRVIELGLVCPEKVVVLGSGSSNGVDFGRFRSSDGDDDKLIELRGDLDLQPEIPIIGFIGRLNKDKGIEVLLEASKILGKGGVSHNILAVGSSENSRLAEYVRQSQNARLVGAVTDPGPYYRLMDILCLPTLREGFPNVVLEAATLGVPAVTTNATGAVDSVVHGQTGLITEAGSPDSLAEGLMELLSNSQMRRDLGSNAREWVLERFRSEVVWENVINFVERELSLAKGRESGSS